MTSDDVDLRYFLVHSLFFRLSLFFQDNPTKFHGKRLHKNLQFKGLRISIVFYINERCMQLTPENRKLLEDAGVNLPTQEQFDALSAQQKTEWPKEASQEDYDAANDAYEKDLAAEKGKGTGTGTYVKIKQEKEIGGGGGSSSSSSSSKKGRGKGKKGGGSGGVGGSGGGVKKTG